MTRRRRAERSAVRRRARIVGAAAITAFFLSSCGDRDGSTVGYDRTSSDGGELLHVHDLLVGDGGTPVYLATHSGLQELRNGEPTPRGDRSDDLMAAALDGNRTLIASGHPDLTRPELRVEGRPPLLGLVESEEGSTWTARSLLGEADFHALVVLDGEVYGADSTSARVLVSDDGGWTWETRAGQAQLLDLAVDPTDPDRMVGVDLDRGLSLSADGGNSWTPAVGAPRMVGLVWTTGSLVGIDPEGTILTSTDAGLTWGPAGSVPGAEVLGSDGTDLYAYAASVGLHRSTDGGASWSEVEP